MFAIFTLYSTVKECLAATKVIRADLRAVLDRAVEYCSARPCRLDSTHAQDADACLSGPDIRGVQSVTGFDGITETPPNANSALVKAAEAEVPEPTTVVSSLTPTVERQDELELSRALKALRKSIAEATAACMVVKSPHHIVASGVSGGRAARSGITDRNYDCGPTESLGQSSDALAETPAPEAVVPRVVLAEEIDVPQVAIDATQQDTGVQQLATEATIQDTGVPQVAVPDDVPQVVAEPLVEIEVSHAEVPPIPPPDAEIDLSGQTTADSETSGLCPWYDLGDAYYLSADLLTPEQQAQTEPFEFSFGYAPCTWDGQNWFIAEYRVIVTPPWC